MAMCAQVQRSVGLCDGVAGGLPGAEERCTREQAPIHAPHPPSILHLPCKTYRLPKATGNIILELLYSTVNLGIV
jgi:hypothetical protein